MKGEPHFVRFMSYLGLFTFSMAVLVTAPSLLQMFLGWEGVGICSYLLIGFWYTRVEANKAAFLAMMVNKVGDMAMIVGIVASYSIWGSVNFNELCVACQSYMPAEAALPLSCFFIAAMAKSAQFGLHM